ncbi:hypothetical protein [Anabaena sp. UHCC 0451]|uniref:hypothetical protein n=1 Tax=Anabaena sp. UHCC 0451 TaxID=2055235 RepID=UPI002B221452|nr:hypothetical protein [Anabaena sp. UHCC 0451]MEA5577343.1 hypothetical protein [Anabaena sp. UHCC 0451]
MLFKLTLPYIDKKIAGGRIIRWYKQLGDWVDYGEDLCEIQVENKKGLNRPKGAIAILSPSSHQGDRFLTVVASEKLKICTSDTGFLRLIAAPEKKYVTVGNLLAILTSDPDEPIDNLEQDSSQLSGFRVIVNIDRSH